jgi:hypothetical protein
MPIQHVLRAMGLAETTHEDCHVRVFPDLSDVTEIQKRRERSSVLLPNEVGIEHCRRDVLTRRSSEPVIPRLKAMFISARERGTVSGGFGLSADTPTRPNPFFILSSPH